MTDTSRTYEALAGLRNSLPLLDDAKVPGTPGRWHQRDLTDEQRQHMNTLVRAEREAKAANLVLGIKALGDGKAPLNLSALQTQMDIITGIAELESAVCDRLGIIPLDGATTTERISRIIGLLDRIAAWDDLADHVHTEAIRLHRRARRALGDNEAVHRLDGRCPICDARSLRAFPERELVVCVNTSCRCDSEDCPCQWDRPQRHRWPYDQWPWLAQVLADDLKDAS